MLPILEVSRLARAVFLIAEIEEAAVGEQTGSIGPLVERRTTYILQAEAREHSGFGQHLSRVFVGHSHRNGVRDFQAGIVRVRESRGPDRHVNEHPIRIRRVMPQEEFVRLAAEVVSLALGHRQARIRIDAERLHSSDVVGPCVPNKDVAVFSAGGRVHERAKLALIESLVPFEHGRDLAHLNRRLLLGIRLDLENVDRMPHAGAVPMTNEDAVAGDTQASPVAPAVKVSAFPASGGGVFHRRHR